MIHATYSDGRSATTAPDPSMLQLAPRPSSARNLLLIAVVVVALVAAVFSPNILRPSVSRPNGGYAGSWSALPSHQQVMTATAVTAQTWPRVDIQSINGVPGARPAGAWMVDESELSGFDDQPDESGYDSGLSFLSSAMPDFNPERDALPQSLGHGDSAILIVLWDIDSCDDLDGDPVAAVSVETRTIIRTSSTENLPEIASPGFDVELLRRTGACA